MDNGVRVVLIPTLGVESVAMGVYVRAGSRDETFENNGISHFLEHSVFRNKDTDKIEAIGGIKNGGTYSESTMFEAKLPGDKWEMGLKTISEMVIHPHLLPEDIKKEQGIVLEEINRREDAPDEKVGELFCKMRFPSQGVGLTTLGKPEVIKALDTQKLKDYHQRSYVSQNIVVAMAGKIYIEPLKTKIEEIWGSIPKKGAKKRDVPHEDKTPKVAFEEHVGAEQIQFILGGRGYTTNDRKRFVLAVLSRILKFGLSGRLYQAVREKRGLAYVIDFGYDCEADYGYWGVDGGVKPDNLKELIAVIKTELSVLTSDLVTDQELASAKERCRVPLLFSMENPMRQMDFYARQALDRPDNILTYSDVINHIMNVTAKDVLEVAQELFDPNNFNLAMVGAENPKYDTIPDI